MRLGQHDTGQQLSLEAMGYPNHYLAYDHADVIVLQPVGSVLAAGTGTALDAWLLKGYIYSGY